MEYFGSGKTLRRFDRPADKLAASLTSGQKSTARPLGCSGAVASATRSARRRRQKRTKSNSSPSSKSTIWPSHLPAQCACPPSRVSFARVWRARGAASQPDAEMLLRPNQNLSRRKLAHYSLKSAPFPLPSPPSPAPSLVSPSLGPLFVCEPTWPPAGRLRVTSAQGVSFASLTATCCTRSPAHEDARNQTLTSAPGDRPGRELAVNNSRESPVGPAA